MSRPLRIEYPSAWYHVMNRGRRGEAAFTTDEDRGIFVDPLKEAVELWNIKVAAYCLLSTHYHLLVQTPDANLSRCMRHINGVYTQRFNREHTSDGQLFRGRYKAIVIDADSYLGEVLRYIHRNPLRAGLVENLDEYPWSSQRGYVSSAKEWDWLYTDMAFSLLTEDRTRRMRVYRRYMSEKDTDEMLDLYESRKWPSIVGSDRFIALMKERFFDIKGHREVPESRVLAPEREMIRDEVCREYQIDEGALLMVRRGVSNEPRDVSLYLIRRLRGDRLEEIAKEFGLHHYSSVSNAIERVNNQLVQDRRLHKMIETIQSRLTSHQSKT
ncbi:MAG: transposase [Deltaproteobacteria bacterium RBG_13_52_11]|nr:MAG: transposase [Deltaproteobacteria bacterium RBG_13_52_11]